MAKTAPFSERCAICGCELHRDGVYAEASAHGWSHATAHHHVAERFFGRSKNRRGEQRSGIFSSCPWRHERTTVVLCYECHEELVHNPVFLPEDITKLAALVKRRGLDEETKSSDRQKIAGRIVLLHDVIVTGLDALSAQGHRGTEG